MAKLSDAMLDLSMSGLTDMVDTIGGWLGVDGSMHAGEPWQLGVREHNVCRLHSQRIAKFERSGADKDASGNEDDLPDITRLAEKPHRFFLVEETL